MGSKSKSDTYDPAAAVRDFKQHSFEDFRVANLQVLPETHAAAFNDSAHASCNSSHIDFKRRVFFPKV
ncbi:hypothetical protein E4U49_007886, partial [Claviceps purpurea]